METGPMYTKTANTVLYLLDRCREARPGVTHLVKMIWFADYWHYQEHLRFVTGGSYVAAERGPLFVGYEPLLDRMEGEGAIRRRTVKVFGGAQDKVECEALMEADESVFTDSEMRILARVVTECGSETGNSLSRRTHTEGPWPLLWNANGPATQIPQTALRWIENLPVGNDLVKAKAKRSLERAPVAAFIQSLKSA